jgi:hypothetical protein
MRYEMVSWNWRLSTRAKTPVATRYTSNQSVATVTRGKGRVASAR